MMLERLLRPWRGRLTSSRLEPWLRLLPSLLYMALIFAISAIPGRDIPAVADDRIAHFTEYAIFGLVLTFSVAAFSSRGLEAWGYAAVGAFGVAFGASDEWHQSFVAGRDSSLKDLAFDAIGLTAALLLMYLLVNRRESRS